MCEKKGKFVWSKEATISLIDLYQNKPILYVVDDPDYKNKIKRQNALEDIKNELLKLDFCAKQCLNIDDIKTKIHTMRSQFNKEFAKIKASETTGSGTNNIYLPKLWFFDNLLFLTEHDVSTPSISNLNETQDRESEVIFDGEVEELNTSDILVTPTASKSLPFKTSTQREVVKMLQSATVALQEYRGTKREASDENQDDIHNFFVWSESEVRKIKNQKIVRKLKMSLSNLINQAQEEDEETQ